MKDPPECILIYWYDSHNGETTTPIKFARFSYIGQDARLNLAAQCIIDGILTRGDRISDVAIAEGPGTRRTPVRKAYPMMKPKLRARTRLKTAAELRTKSGL